MPKVLILTNTFPGPGGDDFLALEMPYWEQSGLELILAPARASSGKPFPLERATVVMDVARGSNWGWRLVYVVRASVSKTFWQDVGTMESRALRSPRAWLSSARRTGRYLWTRRAIKELQARLGHFDLVYSFWKDSEAYAAASLRSNVPSSPTVTRAHRYDLYAEESPHHHLPLASLFADAFDLVFAVSEEGARRYREQYALTSDVRVARLGVTVPPIPASIGSPGRFSVLSISNCVPVKRLDLMVEALECFAHANPDIHLHWTHIGEGSTRQSVTTRASRGLGLLANASYSFTGHLTRAQITGALSTSGFDLILNTSDSEGIPVSLMEAMSFGIPALARDVGGVNELVDESCGWLLPRHVTPEIIAERLEEAMDDAPSRHRRIAAREKVIRDFSASTNYPAFVALCRELIERRGSSR